jgi:hypothetical protein
MTLRWADSFLAGPATRSPAAAAPDHAIAPGRAGAGLLAHIVKQRFWARFND